MQAKKLVGAATRYIAGRNAVQTVYWRDATNKNPTEQRFMKVSKTVRFDRTQATQLPQRVRQEQITRF